MELLCDEEIRLDWNAKEGRDEKPLAIVAEETII
jgi:hypothetical protein